MKKQTLKNKVKKWEREGVCQDCIDYRIDLFQTFEDSYNDFNFRHDVDNCTCCCNDDGV